MANQTTFNYCMPLGGSCVPGRILVDYQTGNAEWFAGGDTYPTFQSSANTGGTGSWGWTPSTSTSIENLRNNGYVTAKGLVYTNDQQLLKDFYTGNSIAGLNSQRAAAFNNNLPGQGTSLGVPGTRNVAPPPPAPPSPGGGGGTPPNPNNPTTPNTFDVNIAPQTAQKENSYNPSSGNAWIYPTGLGNNQQDYIEFQMLEYGGLKKVGERTFDKILGRVFLPIQPTISDINTVDWQNDTINPLQANLAKASLSVIQGSGFGEAFKGVFDNTKMSDVEQAAALWAAGKAVGTNIFSRFGGAVVNPNLELLFNGPQLRPFNFNFKLSPRSEDEAKQVKGIIRFFKKGMSVRKASTKLFLKAPNVFKITYINGRTGQPHTSINSIKVCALSQCSVDYTPDGSYATFYDNAATMTQYGLTLQFNELEPIFNDNYDEVPGENTIGY